MRKNKIYAKKSLNDLEKLKKILEDYDIAYNLEEYNISDPWAEYHFGDFMKEKAYGIILETYTNKVEGYGGFQTRILFNDKKEFQKINIYE